MAKHVVPVCVKTLFLLGYVLVLFTGQAPAAGEATGGAVVSPCRRRCGDVDVPYPFGLHGDDPSCYLNPVTFSLTCDASFNPPILVKTGTRITNISLHSAQVGVLLGMSYSCYNASGLIDYNVTGIYTTEFTFTLSYTENIYVAIGCDTQAYITGLTGKQYVGGFTVYNYTGGCMSSCHSLDQIQPGECSGIGCCQTLLPKGIRAYLARTYSVNNHTDVLNINPCSYSFVVEKRNWAFKVTDLTMPITREFPAVFDWFVSNQSCEIAMEDRTSYACISNHSHCINSTNGAGYICKCSQGYQGNPYEQDGCQDINECGDPKSCHRQAVCVNTPGNYSCICPVGTAGDPYTYGCVKLPHKQTRLRAVLGISVGISCGFGILLLLLGITIMQKRLMKKRLQLERKRCFKNNHALLLRQITYCDPSESIIDRIKFISLKDLEKSTNNFDNSRVVGVGGHGTVYKGILNLQVVAIKKSKVELEFEKEQFINEIILLSQIIHRNVIRLVGCCLESEVPILVYEFISNDTLASHLHLSNHKNPLSWHNRLRIATEISSAVTYMHKKANVSIYHRDLKSSNILLDDALTVKVSDFGSSRTLLVDQTHISTDIQGTLGYIDPEYMHTGRLTDKSDVYSLGVILVELMTGETAMSRKRHSNERNLISHFIWAAQEGKLHEVVDPIILEDINREELELISELLVTSLCLKGEDRPTMKEVELTLEGIMKRNNMIIKRGYMNAIEG